MTTQRRNKLIKLFFIDILIVIFVSFLYFNKNNIYPFDPYKSFLLLSQFIIFLFLSGGYELFEKPINSIKNKLIIVGIKIYFFLNLVNLISFKSMYIFNKGNIYKAFFEKQIFFITIIGFFIFFRYVFMVLNKEIQNEFNIFIDGTKDELLKFKKEWFSVTTKISLRNEKYKELFNKRKSFCLGLSNGILSKKTEQKIIQNYIKIDPIKFKVFSFVQLFEIYQERIPCEFIEKNCISFQEIPWNSRFTFMRKIKRYMDIAISFVLIILFLPLIIICSIFIWIEDPGPVFYTQKRSGWLRDDFKIIKLRTMYKEKNKNKNIVLLTQKDDKRITNFGKFLRKSRIDELPQLINVIKGEMSLIGPRPDLPEIDDKLMKIIPHYEKRYWMQPGISGWAQVNLRFGSSTEYSKLKLSYDLYYIKNFSLWNDLIIIAKTFKTLLLFLGD